ncbi:MAG: TolC family protein [Chitinophagaceae bacterium]
MKQIIKLLLVIGCVAPIAVRSQVPVLPLDTVLQRIDRNNLLLQSYGLKASAYKYSAEAATAWMAPMVGVGTFMTPYPFQGKIDDADKGNLMLQLEQDIPNTSKQQSKKQYLASLGDVENATRAVTLNDLKTQARRLYYNWLIAYQRIQLLQQNEKIMVMMKKIEEVRYPYNQSQLSSVYKAEAKIEENRNMIRMQEGLIAKARSWINSLMNAPGNEQFTVDTSYIPDFTPAASYDTATLAGLRKDVWKMNETIRSMQLNIESMKKERHPDFRVRFEHMQPLSRMMPYAYSVMGMVSIPIVPWASRMYKSGIKAMQYNVEGMQKERSAMLQESQGMLYGMQYEIQTMQRRIESKSEKVIPALQKSLDADFAKYQENTLALVQVISSWEALTMTQLEILDEKLKLYEMIADYEKQLYR